MWNTQKTMTYCMCYLQYCFLRTFFSGNTLFIIFYLFQQLCIHFKLQFRYLLESHVVECWIDSFFKHRIKKAIYLHCLLESHVVGCSTDSCVNPEFRRQFTCTNLNNCFVKIKCRYDNFWILCVHFTLTLLIYSYSNCAEHRYRDFADVLFWVTNITTSTSWINVSKICIS